MRHTRLLAWAICAAAFTVTPARALTPDEICVLFNTGSPSSLRIARYYMNARKIPANHLIAITCDSTEGITEEQYRAKIVPQVRRALDQQKLTDSTKCLVTTYDCPLRIFARIPTPDEAQEITAWQKQLNETLDTLEKQVASYDAIRPASPSDGDAASPPSSSVPATHPESRTWQTVVQKLNVAATSVGRRVERLSGPDRVKAMAEFLEVQERVVGPAGVVSNLRVNGDSPESDEGRRRLNALATQVQQWEQQYADLQRRISEPAVRKLMVSYHLRSDGLVGQARAMDEMLTYLRPESTESCFDSELALALADQGYSHGNWIVNPLNLESFPMMECAAKLNAVPRTLMICRVDGLTPAKVQEMIDTTLKVEATGLEGKIYIDARGLRGADAYAAFDAELRRTAEWLREHATINVVLEDTPALLAAKDAPEAALYCGWYNLNNYQDSGQWVKGAVGYHVASYEMPTLHNPKETGWVPNLLNHGFCGTLGATDEPYLSAFPRPSLFFPLLLSGEFTQGEVWQVTNPTLSWRIGYVGDPLYNPFKVKPRVSVEDLKADTILRNAFTILRAVSPASQPAPAARP